MFLSNIIILVILLEYKKWTNLKKVNGSLPQKTLKNCVFQYLTYISFESLVVKFDISVASYFWQLQITNLSQSENVTYYN